MGHITKAMLRACTGLAMTAAVVAGGAAAASAATNHPGPRLGLLGRTAAQLHWNTGT
jgi:hypothetical protein